MSHCRTLKETIFLAFDRTVTEHWCPDVAGVSRYPTLVQCRGWLRRLEELFAWNDPNCLGLLTWRSAPCNRSSPQWYQWSWLEIAAHPAQWVSSRGQRFCPSLRGSCESQTKQGVQLCGYSPFDLAFSSHITAELSYHRVSSQPLWIKFL